MTSVFTRGTQTHRRKTYKSERTNCNQILPIPYSYKLDRWHIKSFVYILPMHFYKMLHRACLGLCVPVRSLIPTILAKSFHDKVPYKEKL